MPKAPRQRFNKLRRCETRYKLPTLSFEQDSSDSDSPRDLKQPQNYDAPIRARKVSFEEKNVFFSSMRANASSSLDSLSRSHSSQISSTIECCKENNYQQPRYRAFRRLSLSSLPPVLSLCSQVESDQRENGPECSPWGHFVDVVPPDTSTHYPFGKTQGRISQLSLGYSPYRLKKKMKRCHSLHLNKLMEDESNNNNTSKKTTHLPTTYNRTQDPNIQIKEREDDCQNIAKSKTLSLRKKSSLSDIKTALNHMHIM